MSDEELDLITVDKLDQPMVYDTSRIFAEVDEVVARSLTEHNPDIAFGAAKTLLKAGYLAGVGLARLLYLMYNNWHRYEIDMDFFDAAMETTGKSRRVIERYMRDIAELHEGDAVPEQFKEQITGRPLADQNAIATAVASGYPISDDQWEKLANANNGVEVLAIMREIKGTPPRKNTLSLKLTRDGDIYVWYQGESFHVGWLDVNEAEENEPIKKAIDRILSNAGIMRE